MAENVATIESKRRDDFPIVFKNGSSETIPAFAIMQVSSVAGVPVDQAQIVTVVKPTGTTGPFIINGPRSVRAGKYGQARSHGAMVLAYSGGAPSAGATVGPSAGSWYVSTSGTGYTVLGGAESNVVLCVAAGGGSGSGTTSVSFGRVTTEVTPAASATTWGTGQVKIQDSATGALAGSAIDVDNLWIGITWVVDAQVAVDGGYSPPRVINGTCAAVAW